MNKKIISNLIISLSTIGAIFAIPQDPNSFYGDISVNNEVITDSKLNYYLNNNFVGSTEIVNSKYGQGYNKIVISGKTGDTIEFEFDSSKSTCASSTEKFSYAYVAGEVQKLDLDFTGTNTCNDEPTDTNTGGSSGDRSSSSGGSVSENIGTITSDSGDLNLIGTETEPESEKESSNRDSTLRTSSLIQSNPQSRSGEVEDIEVIKTEKSNTIESDLEVKKETVTALSGNIVKNNPKSMSGILALVLCITGFFIWRQNKVSKIKTAAAIKASSKKKE